MLVVKKGNLIGVSFIALLYWNTVLKYTSKSNT